MCGLVCCVSLTFIILLVFSVLNIVSGVGQFGSSLKIEI